jgi:hypothetical protein
MMLPIVAIAIALPAGILNAALALDGGNGTTMHAVLAGTLIFMAGANLGALIVNLRKD